jgi:pimeloyl-ACP methyl ester carboxylesterase
MYDPGVGRIESDFESAGTRCAAWLFLPESKEGQGADSGPPPIVVMAHGFGGQREMRLPAFAERFASRGLAALVFDYRCFGDSDGEPRNLIDPRRHLEDWRAAIEHVRASPQLDAGRLALWGTSFSGGHVLAIGSEVAGISAIVSQVPFVGFDRRGPSMPLGQMVRAVFSGLRDMARAARGASPYYVPIAGSPQEFAFLNTPDAMDYLRDLVPPGSTWENRVPARVLFQMPRYRPLRNAAKIEAPVLMVAAENDSLIPVAGVRAASQSIPDCELVVLPKTGHFEPYIGEVFERVVEREAEFLCERLLA